MTRFPQCALRMAHRRGPAAPYRAPLGSWLGARHTASRWPRSPPRHRPPSPRLRWKRCPISQRGHRNASPRAPGWAGRRDRREPARPDALRRVSGPFGQRSMRWPIIHTPEIREHRRAPVRPTSKDLRAGPLGLDPPIGLSRPVGLVGRSRRLKSEGPSWRVRRRCGAEARKAGAKQGRRGPVSVGRSMFAPRPGEVAVFEAVAVAF
jgi:hypothetical protein